MNEVEYMLKQDEREKRRAGNGVMHKTGKRGYVGKIVFPSDYVDRRKDKNYKAGKVEKYMLDERDITLVKSRHEILDMPEAEAKAYMDRIMPHYTRSELKKHFKMSNSNDFFKFLDKLGVEYVKRKYTKSGEPIGEPKVDVVPEQKAPEQKAPEQKVKEEKSDDYTVAQFFLSGKFAGDELFRKICAGGSFVNPDKKYRVTVSLTELEG